MPFNLSKRPNVKIGIDMSDFCLASEMSGLPISRIRAVDEVESAGSGFLSQSNRPKILFEGHLFYRELAKLGLAEKGRAIDPTIVYPKWTKDHYIGRNGEYARLAKATEICKKLKVDDDLALRSTSWGRYQILGSNYKAAGFDSVEAFVEAMFLDEDNHLEAFLTYLDNTGLDELLRSGNYERFAAKYNGPGYKRNAYQIKIPNAVRKFDKQKIDCSSVKDGVHVVEAMPGIRFGDPAEDGFENTSLDERHTEPITEEIELNDAQVAPEGEKPSDTPQTPAISVKEAGTVVSTGDAGNDTAKKVEAASNLPVTEVKEKEKTGFLNKVWAAITAIVTGGIVIPQWITNGITWETVQSVGLALYELRYWIGGALALWFLVNKIESLFLRKKVIDTNTDPEKGNVILTTLDTPSLWQRLKKLFKRTEE